MKKELIKNISNRSFQINYIGRMTGFYLGFDLMGKMANNTFVKSMLLFNYYSLDNKESYGITYKKEINSLFYKVLNNIAEQTKNIDIFDSNNSLIEYNIDVNKKHSSSYFLYSFFKVSLSDLTIDENLRREHLEKIKTHLISIYHLNLTNLITILNACISGSIPLFSYDYEVKSSEQVYYSFKQEVFIKQNTDKLEIEERNISYNPHNIEVYTKLENNRNNIFNSLKSNFGNLVPSYFIGKGKNRIPDYFKLDTIFLDFTLPISLNLNKHFNDEDAVFKFKEEYECYQGKISAKRFLELKEEFNKLNSFSKLSYFLNNLELIEG